MLLRMENIVKNFGSVIANNDVNLTLNKGEILAVIGENGAGKTTLMKILYGLHAPTKGHIFLEDKEVHFKNPAQAIAKGIGMVQQHFMLFEPFTVAENIVYGKEPTKGMFFDLERANKEVEELSRKYELPLNPRRKLHGMPVGLRQRVEIMKVLYQNTDIIIFDEPTAVLTPQEVKELLKTMKLLSQMGKSIIIITHKLEEVMDVADRAMVMRNGLVVDDVKIEDTSIEDLSFKMVGRQLIDKSIETGEVGENVLMVKDLNMTEKGASEPILNHVNIKIDAGEIVGIAGVSGNGQTELIDTLFGLKKADSGQVTLKGESIFNQSVRQVRDAGVALVPEDRTIWGSAGPGTLNENTIMGHYLKPEFSKNGILNKKNIHKFTQGLIDEFTVKADSPRQKISSLSGGNAQKLIVAREFAQHSPLLIACEPTRGVDIGAMEFIHDSILNKRENGAGILLVSSELSEIMKLSDRIYVMYEGKITGEFTRENANEEDIGLLMAGGTKNNE